MHQHAIFATIVEACPHVMKRLGVGCVTQIVIDLERAQGPNLGLATTAQLLEELKARAVVGGYDQYRTIDS